MLVKKCRPAKDRESRRRQRQSGAAENRALQLGVMMWFEAALLDVNGSPDLPDIRMNVTECHCGFLHLHCQHCGASTCISKAWCCEGVVFQVSPTLIETAAP